MQDWGKCRGIVLGTTALALLSLLCPVFANPFEPDDSQKTNHRHSDFMRSLGEASDQMRHDHDWSNSQQAQRHHSDQLSIQNGTQAEARQAFEASQMQAAQSGGMSNGNSNFQPFSPMGIGGLGIGGFGIAPVGIPGAPGTPQADMQAGGIIKGPQLPPAATEGSLQYSKINQNHDREQQRMSSDRFNNRHYDPFAGFVIPAKQKTNWINNSHP